MKFRKINKLEAKLMNQFHQIEGIDRTLPKSFEKTMNNILEEHLPTKAYKIKQSSTKKHKGLFWYKKIEVSCQK